MKSYNMVYCKAYGWYKTSEKKNPKTVRLMALVLLSVLPNVNILTIIILIEFLQKHSGMPPIFGSLIFVLFFIINCFNITVSKSQQLLQEFKDFDNEEMRKANITSRSYLIGTIIFFLLIVILVVYYKAKYGNYDA